MNTTVYVPARLNSERLPRKVLLDFNGNTLVGLILEKLARSKCKNNFFLNTDDEELITYVEKLGHKVYIRSKGLTNSDTTTEEILLDFVKGIDCSTEYVAAINPTNPLLTTETINNFIEQVYESNFDTAFSVSPIKKHCLIDSIPMNYSPFGPHPRTQDVKEIKMLNWAIVMWKTSYVKDRIKNKGDSIYLGKVGFINIPDNEATDIDTAMDFELALELSKLVNRD
jgi:CMP-N-acetylneuraminic acid synthetase